MFCLLLQPRQAFRSLLTNSHLFYSSMLPLYTWTPILNSMCQGGVINCTQVASHKSRFGCSHCQGSRPITAPSRHPCPREGPPISDRQQWPPAEPAHGVVHLAPEVTSADRRSDKAVRGGSSLWCERDLSSASMLHSDHTISTDKDHNCAFCQAFSSLFWLWLLTHCFPARTHVSAWA